MSASLDKSTKKTSIGHNNRTMNEDEWEKNEHIDKTRLADNKYLIQKSLRYLYQKEFGDALAKYNDKQKRADRKIKNYYDHIKKGKRSAIQQEMIIQVGDRDDFKNNPDNWEMANEVLEKWLEDFQERNPNLKVYNAVIHNDESSPHLHINFVPVAGDYERGLEKQVGFNRAILQQDENKWLAYKELQQKIKDKEKERKATKGKKKYELTEDEKRIDDPFADWRETEIGALEKLLNERGIERKLVGKNDYKDMDEFKKMTDGLDNIKKEIEIKQKELMEISDVMTAKTKYPVLKKEIETEVIQKRFGDAEIIESETGNYVITHEQYEEINEMIYVAAINEDNLKRLRNSDSVKENVELKKENKALKNSNSHFREENMNLRFLNGDLKDREANLLYEIGIIYRTYLEFLKERSNDWKSMADDLVTKFRSKFSQSRKNDELEPVKSEFENIHRVSNPPTRKNEMER